MKETYKLLDIFKLLFSFCVVYNHVALYMGVKGIINSIIFYFVQVGVPFFFCCSAFFLFEKGFSRQVVKKYVIKILLMYIFWTIALFPLRISDLIHINNMKSLVIYFAKYIRVVLFIGEYQLWYLLGILQAVFMLALLKKLRFNEKAIIIMALLMFVLYQILDFNLIDNVVAQSVVNFYYIIFGTIRNGIFTGFIYMTIGMVLSKYKDKIKMKKRLAVTIAVILLYVAGAYGYIVNAIWGNFLLPFVVVGTFILGITVNENKENKNPIIIRKVSTLVYVAHVIFLRILLTFGIENYLVIFLLTMSITIMFSFIIALLSKRIKILRYIY